MKSYKYKKLNAFTSGNSLGNPAAFLDLGNDVLSENEMLNIAKEHKGFVSEVIFLSRISTKIKLTYYSSECEVSFCGHGTIATMYELIKNDPELLKSKEIQIVTNIKGEIAVYNKILAEDAVYITAPEVIYYGSKIPKKTIADNLGIKESIITESYPVDIIDAGLRTLIVPIDKYENEISIYPVQDKLQEFCLTNEIDIILIFSKETQNSQCFAHTRVFAPKFGYLEDPATGSGNSAFGYYLLKNKLWDGTMISIEQGSDKMNFNEVKLVNYNNKVLFGGRASKTIDGIYHVN
jgi:PhzF family phenazine biosynthesis protein